MNLNRLSLAVASATLVMSGAAVAVPVTFTGQDIHNTNTKLANPLSDAAQTAFLASLTGVGVETFEGLTTGAVPPITLIFPGAGTATLNGSGSVAAGDDGGGRYAISGSKYYNSSSGNFSIAFSSNIAAFGFYGIDLGDYGGSLSLTLTDSNNVVTTLAVPYVAGAGGSTNGSVLYFGFYDTAKQYKNIAFTNTSGGQDVFAFDNMVVGSLQQVRPAPEPETLALLGIGLLGFGLHYRRRSKA